MRLLDAAAFVAVKGAYTILGLGWLFEYRHALGYLGFPQDDVDRLCDLSRRVARSTGTTQRDVLFQMVRQAATGRRTAELEWEWGKFVDRG